ncbi:splicing factor 3b (nucleomorph) [Lotharella oceanica]|uniref:Splicing factor 3b n=2 Tax=Lotharella oceanica TaxID=641309 RepID=A0A060DGA6_9EUKA|nr:splicing factor 3b [Lotharella oceanica]
MYFYNIKLQKNAFIKKVISGNFSDKFINEFLIIKIKNLDLFEININGILNFVSSSLIFGLITSIAKLKVPNSNKNLINCGSNTGGISFLKYSNNNTWVNIFTHFFGRSGCRRIVPGYHICNDLKGRACIITAIEKLRFVYIINHKFKDSGIISSPVEIQKSNSIITNIAALENKFNNPCFATIEIDKYEMNESYKNFSIRISKFLVFYEFDLGLNILITSYLVKLNIESNIIIPLHYGFLNTPSCLINNNKFIILKNKYRKEIFLTLPKRIDEESDYNNILTTSASLIYKNNNIYLIQDENGNLFQLNTTISNKNGEICYLILLKHIDTIHPSYNIEILKKGFLFISSINSYHSLMKFNNKYLLNDKYFIKSTQLTNLSDIFIRPLFKVIKKKNLIEIKKITTLTPIHNVNIHHNTYTNDNKLYLLNGVGFSSYLSSLEYGLKIIEMACSTLPIDPKKLWIIQTNSNNIIGSNIIIGFEKFTVVLKIGKMIFENNSINLSTSEKTLHCTIINSINIIQISNTTIRHIKPNNDINLWKLPKNLEIQNVASNSKQIIIGISNYNILYFEMNCFGYFLQIQIHDYKKTYTALSLPSNISDTEIVKFFIITDKFEKQFKILSLNPENWFSILSIYSLPLNPLNLKILRLNNINLVLFISFKNGTLLELKINEKTYSIYHPKIRFIGVKFIKFSSFFIYDFKSVSILSNRTYFIIPKKQEIDLRILSNEKIIDISGFSFTKKIVLASIFKKNLTISTIDNIENYFSEINIPIYSRGIEILIYNPFKTLFILENELYEKQKNNFDQKKTNSEIFEIFNINKKTIGVNTIQILSQKEFSCNSFFITNSKDIMNCMELIEYKINNKLISFIIVGSRILKKTFGFIYIYRIYNKGRKFKLIYRTFIKNNPLSLINIYNNIIIGSESYILFKKIGKKRLLNQTQISIHNAHISTMQIAGTRFIIGDFNNGLLISKIIIEKYELNFFARSIIGKYIETIILLDYDTICISDLNGNFAVFRISKELSIPIEKGYQIISSKNGIKFEKLKNIDLISIYNIGESIKKFLKLNLLPWKNDILLYLTILGGIGCFLPLNIKKEIIFLTNLNLFLHQESISLISLNNYIDSPYYPTKRMFDAEFCESIKLLPNSTKITISKGLKVKIETITKYLDSLKLKVL